MNAQEVIQRWGLQPHPEGGYYRELYRSPTGGFFGVASGGGRPGSAYPQPGIRLPDFERHPALCHRASGGLAGGLLGANSGSGAGVR
jgi:hypothetical protein